MSGEHTDPRVQPQAIRTVQPGGSIDNATFAPLRADQFGCLWVSVGDPSEGIAVDVDILDSNSPLTGFNFRRVLMVGGIQLVDDPTTAGGQYAQVERGFLNADTLAATRVAQLTSAALSGWNPATAVWNRARVLARGVDITSPNFDAGILATAAGLYLSNAAGTIQSQLLSADTTAAALNASANNWLPTASALYASNNAGGFHRVAIASAGVLSTLLSNNALLTTAPGEWTITSAPAAGVQASATRAGGGRHVLRSICADLTAVAAITAPLTLVVRDGASGVGAILWQRRLTAPVGETKSVEISGLNIVGSTATAMTVEFTAAPAAGDFQTISATGFSAT